MSKREQIIGIIMNMLSQDLLTAGEMIPSIREMANMYDMSVTPVIEAYHDLEKKGVIVPQSKSRFVIAGGYNSRHRFTEEMLFDSTRFSDFHSTYYSLLHSDITYPFGQPSVYVEPSSNEEMLKVFTRLARNGLAPELIKDETFDVHDFKTEICKWMIKYNCPVEADDILVTDGSLHSALSLALQCCARPGAMIGVSEPGSIAHYLSIRMKNLIPVPISMVPGVGIDLDSFEHLVNVHPEMKCIILSANFDVPTGTLMSDENKRRLANICRQRDILIIEDDCTGSYNYEKFRPCGIIRFAPERTIYIAELNFTGTNSMGIHWLCSPIYKNELRYYRDMTGIAPSEMLQHCYLKFINSNRAKKRRDVVCRSHMENTAKVRQEIYSCFPDGTNVSRPDGGFFLWARLPNGCDSLQLLRRAYKYGVSFTPGFLFSDADRLSDYICLNCSIIDGRPDKLEGIRILGRLCREMSSESAVPLPDGKTES